MDLFCEVHLEYERFNESFIASLPYGIKMKWIFEILLDSNLELFFSSKFGWNCYRIAHSYLISGNLPKN